MATLRLDILELRRKYAHLGEAELRRTIKEIEKKFYDFGKQFPGTELHERSRSAWDAFGSGHIQDTNRILVLSGVPDDVVHEAWADILPALPEHTPELPEHEDETPDAEGSGGCKPV